MIDTELTEAKKRFTINPPKTKEALFIRLLFLKHFGGSERAAETVKVWTPKWQLNDDPSGRASAQHLAVRIVIFRNALRILYTEHRKVRCARYGNAAAK